MATPTVPLLARAMAEALLDGDLTAALGLTDWLNENVPEADTVVPDRLYIYDNGQGYDRHTIDWITAPLDLLPSSVCSLIESIKPRADEEGLVILHSLCPRITEGAVTLDLEPLWMWCDQRFSTWEEGRTRFSTLVQANLTPALASYLAHSWSNNPRDSRLQIRATVLNRCRKEGLLK